EKYCGPPNTFFQKIFREVIHPAKGEGALSCPPDELESNTAPLGPGTGSTYHLYRNWTACAAVPECPVDCKTSAWRTDETADDCFNNKTNLPDNSLVDGTPCLKDGERYYRRKVRDVETPMLHGGKECPSGWCKAGELE
ncbi:unnamed protein product, partial [Amoebophrya sp. A120]